ncbi:MAG: hydroxysqualene dehydroxylase HpnE [Blastocatellia bacterium]|nr:hydroxysqualene dehydroxylase HpnE [Blastocatellia bacterium]
MKSVSIIGGGFAGLAAGVALADAGWRVHLIEKRPFLGGRAYSFLDSTTGSVVDNGQHLMMGCYRETFAFLKKIGSLDLVHFQDRSRVDFLDAQGQATLECPQLPAPLHLFVGLLGLKGLSLAEKLGTLRLGGTLRLKNGKLHRKIGHLTVDEWLTACGQSPRIKERFWEPLAVATLNEDIKIAPATLLAKVLQDGFGGTRRDSSMVTSKVGLSDLYTRQAVEFIEVRGGTVQLKTGVSQIKFEAGRCSGIELTDGTTVQADAYISSVPYFSLRRMIAEEIGTRVPEFAQWWDFRSAPIISINLWFDRPVTDLPFAGLLGTQVQWVFNKDVILNRTQAKTQHLSLILSAAHVHQRTPKEQLVEMAVAELQTVLPASRQAKLVHSFVIKEHDATFSASPAAEKARPGARTSFANFFLAGDWTDTGLPATIEGAVLSGHRAAQLVSEK